MKVINKMLTNNVRAVIETPYYKISFMLMFVFSFYGGYISMNMNYLEGFFTVLTNKMFFTWGVLIPFLIITLCTYKFFDKNQYFISRLTTKKEYLKNMISTVFLVNSFSYIMLVVVVMIGLNLFPKKGGFGFVYNNNVNCNNFIYLCFIILRLFCIVQIISILNIFLCKLLNSKLTVILNMILYSSLLLFFYFSAVPIDNVFKIPLYIGNYLVIDRYINFGMEILCTSIYLSLLLIIIYLLNHITLKRLGDISI